MAKTTAVKEPIVDELDQALEQAETLLSKKKPAIKPDGVGFYYDADWIRIECDWPMLQPREGFEKLWAEIDASLTFQEALAIPIEAGVPMKDLFDQIVHRVRAWNAEIYDPQAQAMVPVPPPSEIGFAALMQVRPVVVEWLAYVIRNTSLYGGPNRKNEVTPSPAGSAGPSDGA